MTRLRPHQVKPLTPAGATPADGTYGLTVAAGVVTGLGAVSVASAPKTAPFKASGTLAAVTGKTKLRNNTSATWTILSIQIDVETAPSGGSVVVDVNKNGTTIFTTQANRPTITAGNTASSVVTNMDITTVAPGDYLTMDIDTATTPSANLTLTLVFT